MKKLEDITIRPLKRSDIARANEFKNFINELIDDKEAFIATGDKKTLASEKAYLKSILSKIKKTRASLLNSRRKWKTYWVQLS